MPILRSICENFPTIRIPGEPSKVDLGEWFRGRRVFSPEETARHICPYRADEEL
jgi:hypothetical protein